jgi:hypothetical protein
MPGNLAVEPQLWKRAELHPPAVLRRREHLSAIPFGALRGTTSVVPWIEGRPKLTVRVSGRATLYVWLPAPSAAAWRHR